MQASNLMSHQVPLSLVSVPKPPSLGDYLRSGSVVVWFMVMIYGFWWQSNWYALIDESTMEGFQMSFRIGFSTVLAAHLTLGLGKLADCPFLIPTTRNMMALLMTTFFILVLVLAPTSLFPLRSTFYALLTWATFCVCHWTWQSNVEIVRKALVLTGLLMLAFLGLLILKHGYAREAVGGINRNRYATAALTAIVFISFSKHRWRYLAILLGLGYVFLVNSRGSILMAAILLLSYVFVTRGFEKFLKISFLGAAVLSVVALIPFGSDRSSLAQRVLKLNDTTRGISSGFSGRFERWEHGFETFWKRPLLGYGFRSRTNLSVDALSAHSGWLNLMLDTGFVGVLLVGLAYLFGARRRYNAAVRIREYFRGGPKPPDAHDTLHFNALCLSLFVVYSMMMVFEPSYFQLGSPFTVMFFLMICGPDEFRGDNQATFFVPSGAFLPMSAQD